VPSAAAPAGLTSAEAARLLISVGVAQHPARRALLKLWAPVPWMLEAAIALQLAIGDYGRPGAFPVRGAGHDRAGDPDADPHGAYDGHRRRAGNVVLD
jgi:hypothetical protein